SCSFIEGTNSRYPNGLFSIAATLSRTVCLPSSLYSVAPGAWQIGVWGHGEQDQMASGCPQVLACPRSLGGAHQDGSRW
ncbi:MAG: hypothetical protein K2Q27_14540, partial [Novosphingobium sp.]|nr:hypothetical protein [Novosphingobium sp.]